MPERNGTKTTIMILASVVIVLLGGMGTLALLVRANDVEAFKKADTGLIDAIKDCKNVDNLQEVAIYRLTTADTIKTEILTAMNKKIDLLLREAHIPESQWPVVGGGH